MSGTVQDDDRNVIYFKAPIPPCRVAVQRPDGSIVLDFPTEDSRHAFRRRCANTVTANCLQGARSSCSLTAIDKCHGPAWLRWLGWQPRKTWAEVEACEEEAMQACMVSSESACCHHAKEFCELVTRRPE